MKTPHRKFVVHRYGAAQWTWTAFARNGKRVGWAGEGHKSRAHSIKAANAMAKGDPVIVKK